ncbi:hypothetical protein HELRODRAFT_88345 [Helobdella robusta]|uniref:DRBM domain-containing protein n=1 Tax=Helobdella robusta TaxID=6412 RepID=T1G716_HELRO|nr:hypothetical protein HELRODRAFT_88345 [Helobdella robusta]ESN93668.1 hypothetical protein HELRODRAFT_88345 [Helobdella robusta]
MSENDSSNLSHKTPVTLLQEICAKKGLKIEYELAANDGPLHRPEFTYVLKAGHLNISASGSSKKQAKHNVALEMLNLMLKPHSVSPCLSTNSLNEEPQYSNPIGKVQELSQKMLWSPPIYEFSLEKGQPHHKLFNCTVSLMKYSMKGYGSSKKLAKRDATTKLLGMLKGQNIINESLLSNGSSDEVSKSNNSSKIYDKLKSAPRLPNLTPNFSQKIARFYQKLRQKPGKTLASLQTLSLNTESINYHDILEMVGQEEQFEILYIDFPELTVKGECQCLVQLSKLKVAICHGTGECKDDAHTDAAHNALQYLKIMTRK